MYVYCSLYAQTKIKPFVFVLYNVLLMLFVRDQMTYLHFYARTYKIIYRLITKTHPSMHIIVVKSKTHPSMHIIVLKSKTHRCGKIKVHTCRCFKSIYFPGKISHFLKNGRIWRSVVIFSKYFKIQFPWPTFQKRLWTVMTIMTLCQQTRKVKMFGEYHRLK